MVEQYGINLAYEYQFGTMSWIEYIELLKSLNDKTLYGKIILARSLKPSDYKNMDKGKARYYRGLKSRYPYIDDFGQTANKEVKNNSMWNAMDKIQTKNIKDI